MKPSFGLLLAALTLPAAAQVAEVDYVATRPLTGPRADVAALLLSSGDSGTLRAAVLASPSVAAGGSSRVEFWVEVEGASLLAGDAVPEARQSQGSVRLELHAYAMTPEGELAGNLSRRVHLPLAELGERLLAGGVKIAGGLDLEPGEYQLRLLVREPRSQRFVLRIVTVAVPSPEASRPILLPPRFADAGAWVTARDAPEDGVEAGPAPAALPVLVAGREQAMSLYGRGLAVPPLTLRLLATSRQEVARLEPRLSASDPGGALQHAEARFDLPPGLATGTYVLEAAVSPQGGGSAVLPIFVLQADSGGDGAGGQAIAWTGIGSLAKRPQRLPLERAAPPASPALDRLAQQRGAQRVAAIAGAYRAVLERLASGATEGAIEELQRLEIEVLSAANRHRAQGWLSTAQGRVIKELADNDPDCLIPLLVLHVGAHDRYLEDGVIDPYILNATRGRILTLAETYAEAAAGDLAPALAASALAELGVALDRAGLPAKARRMLEAALKLDDGNVAVLLYLAYWHERRARYEAAVPILRRLLAVAPRSPEARLRLALTLSRWPLPETTSRAACIGAAEERCAQARVLLRQLIRDGAPEWLLAIAYQELGRLLAVAGDFEAAAGVLEAGVARLPEEQRLYVQWAYALERAGDRQRGQQVAARMPVDAGRPSPRHRYSQRPQAGGEGSRDALRRHAIARLPLLARALAAVGEAS